VHLKPFDAVQHREEKKYTRTIDQVPRNRYSTRMTWSDGHENE
jgi:hypothetical protein